MVKLGRELPEVEEGIDEQEFLTQAQPELYFITPHYIGYPAVLARLATLRVAECRRRLEQGWRLKAPKALLKQRGDPRAPLQKTPGAKKPFRKTM